MVDSKARKLGAIQDEAAQRQLHERQKRKCFRIVHNDKKRIRYDNPKCKKSWNSARPAINVLCKSKYAWYEACALYLMVRLGRRDRLRAAQTE